MNLLKDERKKTSSMMQIDDVWTRLFLTDCHVCIGDKNGRIGFFCWLETNTTRILRKVNRNSCMQSINIHKPKYQHQPCLPNCRTKCEPNEILTPELQNNHYALSLDGFRELEDEKNTKFV